MRFIEDPSCGLAIYPSDDLLSVGKPPSLLAASPGSQLPARCTESFVVNQEDAKLIKGLHSGQGALSSILVPNCDMEPDGAVFVKLLEPNVEDTGRCHNNSSVDLASCCKDGEVVNCHLCLSSPRLHEQRAAIPGSNHLAQRLLLMLVWCGPEFVFQNSAPTDISPY